MYRNSAHVPTGLSLLFQQAKEAAEMLVTLRWPIQGSQVEELDDFHRELSSDALAIRDHVDRYLRDRFRPDWFDHVEGTGWFSLAEDFGYKLSNTEALPKHLDRFYRSLVRAEQYHDVDLDPDDLEANAEVLDQYHSFSYVVVPVLRYCFEVADIYATFQEFGAALKLMARYQQHVWKNRPDSADDVFPSGAKKREIVWHATTAYYDILNHGFKTQEELQGVAPGIGGAVDGISFTSDYRFAQAILLFFEYVVRAIDGPLDLDHLCGLADELDLSCDEILDQHARNYRDLRKQSTILPGEAAEFINQAFWYGGFKRKLINPVAGVGGETLAERFTGTRVEDLGIIEATVNTMDPKVRYVMAEDEWRVPINAIVLFGPVGSQTKKKTSVFSRRADSGADDEFIAVLVDGLYL